MLKQSEKVIGNNTYKVTALGAIKGRAVFIMLLRLFGATADGLKKDTLLSALQDLAKNLTDADLTFLCDTFAKVTDVQLPDGRSPRLADVFDLHFSENYLEMFEWLAFCLEVNFSSFFRGLAERLAKDGSAKQPAASRSGA